MVNNPFKSMRGLPNYNGMQKEWEQRAKEETSPMKMPANQQKWRVDFGGWTLRGKDYKSRSKGRLAKDAAAVPAAKPAAHAGALNSASNLNSTIDSPLPTPTSPTRGPPSTPMTGVAVTPVAVTPVTNAETNPRKSILTAGIDVEERADAIDPASFDVKRDETASGAETAAPGGWRAGGAGGAGGGAAAGSTAEPDAWSSLSGWWAEQVVRPVKGCLERAGPGAPAAAAAPARAPMKAAAAAAPPAAGWADSVAAPMQRCLAGAKKSLASVGAPASAPALTRAGTRKWAPVVTSQPSPAEVVNADPEPPSPEPPDSTTASPTKTTPASSAQATGSAEPGPVSSKPGLVRSMTTSFGKLEADQVAAAGASEAALPVVPSATAAQGAVSQPAPQSTEPKVVVGGEPKVVRKSEAAPQKPAALLRAQTGALHKTSPEGKAPPAGLSRSNTAYGLKPGAEKPQEAEPPKKLLGEAFNVQLRKSEVQQPAAAAPAPAPSEASMVAAKAKAAAATAAENARKQKADAEKRAADAAARAAEATAKAAAAKEAIAQAAAAKQEAAAAAAAPAPAAAAAPAAAVAGPSSEGAEVLKPGWVAVTAEDGRVYYWNEHTDETTWEVPRAAPKPVGPGVLQRADTKAGMLPGGTRVSAAGDDDILNGLAADHASRSSFEV